MTATVECLRCGQQHRLHRSALRQLVDSECPRCGYLGWAYVGDLSDAARRSLRPRSPSRALRLVV
ncbi:MAG TPA: hypothetical protein VK874_11795 [Gaiellaceae bacterium]|nr:hypothetical protein [Gaiellaceae bacterium]